MNKRFESVQEKLYSKIIIDSGADLVSLVLFLFWYAGSSSRVKSSTKSGEGNFQLQIFQSL